MTGHLSHLRQRIELPLDLQSADVGEGLWLQPRSVQDVVAVDQKAVELANHLERAAKGNMRQCVNVSNFVSNFYREENKGLYVVARNFFLLLLNCSAWPCLGPA